MPDTPFCMKFLWKILLAALTAAFFFFIATENRKPPSISEDKTDAALSAAQAGGLTAKNHKKVLLIFPYQPAMPHAILAGRAVNEEFRSAEDLNIELYVEYLDLNRFQTDAYKEQLLRLFEVKYRQQQISLVLLNGKASLEFWIKHRDAILPDVSAVFYDVISSSVADLSLPPGITGVSSAIDHVKSADWLLRIRPQVRELVLVRGAGEADQEDIYAVDALKAYLRGKVQVTDWADVPLPVIKQRAAALPKSSAILYHLLFEDAAGNKFRPIDALRELAAVSAVPVLSGYSQFIGTGSVGGFMFSIEHHAKTAARLGIRILRGEPADSLPVADDTDNQFMFDHPALIRHSIPLSALPPESLVMNRQFSLWEEHWQGMLAVCAIVFSLSVTVAVLLGLNRRLAATRLELRCLNACLEKQVAERTAVLSKTNEELLTALARVQQMEGILPICCFCKKIKDEHGSWKMLEQYIGSHSHAQFSHGFCPECAKKHYPEYCS